MEFIAFFLILGSILWFINRKSNLTKTTRVNKIPYPAWNEIRALSKDPSQMKSYNPDWVLRHLLKIHPEYFAQRDIKQVLADCVPHDEERVKVGRVVSYDWYWIVELLPGHFRENERCFVFLLGWFDPQLQEPRTFLEAWFFPTQEDVLTPAIKGLEEGRLKRKPDPGLYEFLFEQIKQGKKVGRNPQNYWLPISV